jgi:polysaccharide biosynthesis/export protein
MLLRLRAAHAELPSQEWSNNMLNTVARSVVLSFVLLPMQVLLFPFARSVRAQATKASDSSPTSTESRLNRNPVESDYKIGPGDVISVSVAEAPEWDAKYRVSDSGTIEISGLQEPIRADGLSPVGLSHMLAQAFIDAKQLRDPRINVYVDEYHGRTITVLGAVSKPAVYPLTQRTTVLDTISMAGGALPGAGGTITLVRGPASAEATGTAVGSVQIVDLSRIVSGGDVSSNVQVRNGDVINVSTARLVYVVGAVTKSGGFTLSDPGAGISVAKAVALAEGFGPVAATHHCLIIRQSTSEAGRREVPVDVAEILAGKEADVVLAPDDILYVPESNSRKTVRAMGEVAMSLINGIAIYGVGYRLGTMP